MFILKRLYNGFIIKINKKYYRFYFQLSKDSLNARALKKYITLYKIFFFFFHLYRKRNVKFSAFSQESCQ